jgi:hypothetical protein
MLGAPRPPRYAGLIAPGVQNEGAGAYFQDPLTAGEWIHVVACLTCRRCGIQLVAHQHWQVSVGEHVARDFPQDQLA